MPDAFNQFYAELRRCFPAVIRDEAGNAFEVVNGRFGKDYFVVHDATSFSTSSMDLLSPWSSESNPFWMAATTSRRRVISSKLAFSGSCSTVSSAIRLAVMESLCT